MVLRFSGRRVALYVLLHIFLTGSCLGQPNFCFIMADDCTFRDIGCYGGQAHTPHIDALAEEGMRFTRCFQAASMCSPTRHNIYTGLYPVKSGAYPNHTFVDEGTDTIISLLEPLGYRVALSGKRHIKPSTVFDFELLGSGKNPDFPRVDGFLAECAANETPFCLLLCSNEPHTPWDKGDPSAYPTNSLVLPPFYVDVPELRVEMTKYLAEITYYDSQVGDALQLLDTHGLASNTLVIVLSEQGNSLPFAKWTCYDTGIQSACIVRWPGEVAAATTSDAMVEYVDILPTFLDAAGAAPHPELDGESFLPVLRGERATHKRQVYAEVTARGINTGPYMFGIRSVRSERFKYIWNLNSEYRFTSAINNKDFFGTWEQMALTDPAASNIMHRYSYRPREELYDVLADPFEQTNLVGQAMHEATRQELRSLLLRWMIDCGDAGVQTEYHAYARQNSRKRDEAIADGVYDPSLQFPTNHVLAEYLFGPENLSGPTVEQSASETNALMLSIPVNPRATDAVYTIDATTSLTAINWTPVTSSTTSSNTPVSIPLDPASASQSFYRVRGDVVPQASQ